MKKIFIITLLFCTLSTNLFSQWTSPGNGTTYTWSTLTTLTNGVVTEGQEGYDINQDLTISENDVLLLEGEFNVNVSDNVLITIKGSLISDNLQRNHFIGKDGGHFNLCFDNATDCYVSAVFTRTGGIKLIDSDVLFENCDFTNANTQYTSGAVNYFECDPIFINCNFLENEGAAISSGANITGSPKIIDCNFQYNVSSNENQPQINLGPGAEDTIFIVGNTIIGLDSDMSGGIAIADLMNTGSTKALIKDNVIKNNRYGYTQQGYTIDAVIVNNQFIDNNLETNPMNGGSGISIYGYTENCKAKLRNNVITGNLWGITSIYHNSIDLGTEEDWGNNAIYGNGNGGMLYELYNNATTDVIAIGNYWGQNDAEYAESVIFHQPDQADLGLVTFEPVKELYPVFIQCGVTAIDQYNSENVFYYDGVIDTENHMVFVEMPADQYNNANDYSNELSYKVETGVIGDPESNSTVTSPMTINLSTPHGDSQDWRLVINGTTGCHENIPSLFSIYPNPVEGSFKVTGEKAQHISIYSQTGQLIMEKTLSSTEETIKTAGLSAGIYFVKMSNDAHSVMQKIIVK